MQVAQVIYRDGILITGDLLMVVEYCKHGNLKSYLMNNRNNFINLIDSSGNLKPLENDGEQKCYVDSVLVTA